MLTTCQYSRSPWDLVRTRSSVLDLEKTMTQDWDEAQGGKTSGRQVSSWKSNNESWIHLTSNMVYRDTGLARKFPFCPYQCPKGHDILRSGSNNEESI